MDGSLLYGTWYEQRSSQSRRTLDRKGIYPMGWGQKYVFEPDGTFEDSYTARCGNDENLHHWQGTWTFDSQTQILWISADWLPSEQTTFCQLTPYPEGRSCYVEALSHDTLVLSAPEQQSTLTHQEDESITDSRRQSDW